MTRAAGPTTNTRDGQAAGPRDGGTGAERAADRRGRGRASRAETLFHDDFGEGFDMERLWDVPPLDDMVTDASPYGLTVTPARTDPVTGRPVFSRTADGDAVAAGAGDHIKWVALTRGPDGRRGFAVPSDQRIECSTALSSLSFGGDRHPFGAAVQDSESDVRLATAAVITMDPVSHSVFDFVLTNSRVYALYERVPSPGSAYASFSYAVPVADRTPEQWHRLTVAVEAGGTRVVWRADDEEVLAVDRIGHRLPDRRHMLLDHGGKEGEPVRLGRLVCGIGLLTMLDGAGPDGRGLVRLHPGPGHYFSPREGAPVPQEFVDSDSREESRSWGAGAVLRVREMTVRAAMDSPDRGA
ncbi:hypothetical protein GR925_37730 [Streptomyces sp. HUCO-GS316]|uniref:DUF6081 family protein n=1 Tax=Streptomyces sp. HUCO-GS316 TaxID=2692198 RepID=UPI00136BB203|nr:DUF6081 family protein [Streptomyces sp. HUCO-GS316]MXM68983.1 hypothetical protein [Streptomyces sp. HUCO-GS316]